MTILISAYQEGIRTLADGSLKITLTTQEIDNKDAANILSMRNKLLKVAMSDDNIQEVALEAIKQTEITDTGRKIKSKSQRLRNVLFLLWEQDNKGFTSDEFYDNYMEGIIEKIKVRLG